MVEHHEGSAHRGASTSGRCWREHSQYQSRKNIHVHVYEETYKEEGKRRWKKREEEEERGIEERVEGEVLTSFDLVHIEKQKSISFIPSRR